MKLFKKISIASNGTINFGYKIGSSSNKNKLNSVHKTDDKNFSLNQKKVTSSLDSKHSLYYKRKYLN